MSKQYVTDYKEGLKRLRNNGGINRDALFQTVNRRDKFPGNNLHYTYSIIPINSRRGMDEIRTGDRHIDVISEIDEKGNFEGNNYVTNARNYAIESQKRFEEARKRGINLIIIDENSFLNKSLRAL